MEPAVREELVLPSALYAFTFFLFFLSLSFFLLQTETCTVSIKHILKHISHRQCKISILILNHFFYSFFIFSVFSSCLLVKFPLHPVSFLSLSLLVFLQDHTSTYIQSNHSVLMIHVKAADKERIEGKSFPFWNGISVR